MPQYRLSEWIVPPIVPLLLFLLVLAAAVLHS